VDDHVRAIRVNGAEPANIFAEAALWLAAHPNIHLLSLSWEHSTSGELADDPLPIELTIYFYPE